MIGCWIVDLGVFRWARYYVVIYLSCSINDRRAPIQGDEGEVFFFNMTSYIMNIRHYTLRPIGA